MSTQTHDTYYYACPVGLTELKVPWILIEPKERQAGGGARSKPKAKGRGSGRLPASPRQLHDEVQELVNDALFSRRKHEVTRAFTRLSCIATGKCVDLAAREFDGVDFVFEYVRCLLPTRFFQLAKELHQPSARWQYVQPLYRDLFHKVYEDINPETPVVSNGATEDQACALQGTSLPAGVLRRGAKELAAAKAENDAKAKKLRKLRYELLKLEFEAAKSGGSGSST